MSNEFVTRITKIAAELLKGEKVEVTANGEDYYTVSGTADGHKSNFPPVWIPHSASEQQIKDKLAHEFAQNLHRGSALDDLSVPNLQNEGGQKS